MATIYVKKNPGGYLFSYLWFSAQTNWVIDLYLFSTLSAFYTHVYCEVFSKYSLLNVQSYSGIHLFKPLLLTNQYIDSI